MVSNAVPTPFCTADASSLRSPVADAFANPDPFLLAAMWEVDALTPECPPIVPLIHRLKVPNAKATGVRAGRR